MNNILNLLATIVTSFAILSSCKKNMEQNGPPAANAGIDQTILLPANSVELRGVGTDKDGRIKSYTWRKLFGPSSFRIVNPNAPITQVKDLTEGTYDFQLIVTDNDGYTANDIVIVNVARKPDSIPVINVQLILIGELLNKRLGTVAAKAGNKILFGGGYSTNNANQISHAFRTVDVYDFISNTWSTAELSQRGYARTSGCPGLLAAGAGNKVVFAGGITPNGGHNTVDIYDVVGNSWSAAELSNSMMFDKGIVASPNKIFFAGGGYAGSPWSYWEGDFSNHIDIFDASQNTWSTALLSEARTGLGGASAGNKTLIAGGYKVGGNSGQVDIYDATAHTWTTTALSEPRWIRAVTSVGNKIIFASGGYIGQMTASQRVDIYDAVQQNWATESLNHFDFLSPYNRIDLLGGVSSGNFAVFIPVNIPHLLIYDIVSGKWALSSPIPSLSWEAAFVTANDQIYIAEKGRVWKIQF